VERLMKIQDFTGGMNTRINPQFLGLNEGVAYLNIDSSKGSLVPLKDKQVVDGLSLDQYFYWFKEDEEWVSNPGETSYVETRGRLYWVNGTDEPKMRVSGTTYKLGIANPATAITAAIGAAGALTGTYQYVVTYYN